MTVLVALIGFLLLTLSSVRGKDVKDQRQIDDCSAAGLRAVMHGDLEFPFLVEIRDPKKSIVYYELHRRYSSGDRLLYDEISQIEPARPTLGCFVADPLWEADPHFCPSGNDLHVDQGDDLEISRALLRGTSLQLAMTATYIDMITGPAEQTQAEPYFVKLDDGSPKLGFIIPKNAEIGVSFENIEPGAHKVTVGLEYSPRELFPTDAICFEVSAR